MNANKFSVQRSFAISAGAGSGKTYTLSRRYINAILGFDYFREDYKTQKSCFEDLKSARVNEIVTITYTEAAALEMKGRIFELVSKIINFATLDNKDGDYSSIEMANENLTSKQNGYVQETLINAYENSSNSKISTIHAFCLNIIKSNADIARVDAKLDIIKEDEKAKELSKIIFDVLNDEMNKINVLDISNNISMFFIDGLINKYVSSSKFRFDYDSFSKKSISQSEYKNIISELYPLPDVSEAFEEAKDYIKENNIDDGQKYIDFLEEYIEKTLMFEAISWSSLSKALDLRFSFARKPFTKHKTIKSQIEEIKKLDEYTGIYKQIDENKENLFFDKIAKIKTLLHEIKLKYDEKLKELGKIDFDTIITKTLEIMPKVKTNFKYIMVDEFQDTNETQFNIVKNSMNEDTNLFVVGDNKQSIYSFQGAEIEVFNNAVEDKKLFRSIEPMTTNHRSDGVVLNTVNTIFQKILVKEEHLKIISQNYDAQAQDLEVFKKNREEQGSFEYLITSQEYQEDVNELETMAQFISDISTYKLPKYKNISRLIEEKKSAIAIIFDSSSKMLELKQKLKEKGIIVKVSVSDNFYHKKEINDIFNTLKAIEILSQNKDSYNKKEKFYIVGAMRSNILRIDDNSINKHLKENTIPENLIHYLEKYKELTLGEFVKYIYDYSNLFGVYAHFDDVDQRISNLYKFLKLCVEYQDSNETSLYRFLSLLENSIYFSEAKEDEAFYKSENTKSIEICSIHATKGLAYPLVLLGNADKGLYSQITSDSLKHNNFTLNGVKKEVVGFKINDYDPLSLRVLKQIDKLKHLAEKKRLLYVALTRAEHDVVISAKLNKKKDGGISLRQDSYLHMMISSLDISIDELFEEGLENTVNADENRVDINEVEYIEHELKPLTFETKEMISATNNSKTIDEEAANLGTITHKIIELYWENFDENREQILNKMGVYDKNSKDEIIGHLDNFYDTDVYKALKNGAEHRFELEFNHENKKGFIDLVYYDSNKDGWVIVDFKTGVESKEKNNKYNIQLDFYVNALNSANIDIVKSRLVWL